MTDQPRPEPEFVNVLGIDVIPYQYAVWCSIRDGEPFANPIVSRRWSDDGEFIWFMLDSHNFAKCKPDEVMGHVVRHLTKYTPAVNAANAHLYDNALFLERRPKPKTTCPHCGKETA